MENANDHPFKVSIIKDAEMFANDHPFKVSIEGGGGNEGKVVDELPEVGETGYIYLVLKEESSEGNIYDEYMWVLKQDGETYGWEHIGATNEVNLDAVKILTQDDYNWNTQTQSATEPYNSIALWLLDDGLYKAPDVTVRPVSSHSIGGNNANIYLVSKAESGSRRGMVACFMGGSSVLYSAIDDGGMNYATNKFFRNVGQTTGSSTEDLMSQKAITDAINDSVGGAKILTTNDYDWPENNPDGIALWKLSAGVFMVPADKQIRLYTNSNTYHTPVSGTNALITSSGVVDGVNDGGNKFIEETWWVADTISEGYSSVQYVYSRTSLLFRRGVLSTASVVDNLISTSPTRPLSANQGKVLNDKIGQIETVLQTITTGNGV